MLYNRVCVRLEGEETMERFRSTTEFLLAQCRACPALEPRDLLKALHQSVFGCGHFVTDEAAGLARLQEELSRLPEDAAADPAPLDGPYVRLHLGYLRRSGLSPRTLFRLFALSAQAPSGDGAALEEKLRCLLDLARQGRLPFSYAETVQAVESWRAAGFPACRHSEAFRAACAPAYRVIRRGFVPFLPLLAALDRTLAEKPQVIAALEGGSAAGKTTLAAALERIYPDCRVFHTDDFFLRPEQRTEARLAEPGGNVDYERFLAEVLEPLARGETVQYRPYDCRTRTVGGPVPVVPGALNIVEGAYSMHPALAGYYDLSAFLRISPETQRARIQRRNDPETQARFFSTWIPLERRYFDAADTARRCDLTLEVDE